MNWVLGNITEIAHIMDRSGMAVLIQVLIVSVLLCLIELTQKIYSQVLRRSLLVKDGSLASITMQAHYHTTRMI